jgi:hypothetical protein
MLREEGRYLLVEETAFLSGGARGSRVYPVAPDHRIGIEVRFGYSAGMLQGGIGP